MAFLLLVSVPPRTFLKTPYLHYSGGRGGIKMASAKTQSANEPARTSFWSSVELKPTIKAQISGRMASIGISDVVTASVTLRKPYCMMIMIITSNRKTIYYGNELPTTKIMSRCLSGPDATSLHHCLQNQYYTILSSIQALDTKRPVASLG